MVAAGGTQDTVRRGLLYRRHPVTNSEWLKHYFVLTTTRLYYTHACDDESADDQETDSVQVRPTPYSLEKQHVYVERRKKITS